MATLNRTDRLTLDAFSDSQFSGLSYSRFTNRLKNPLIGVKGVQLVNLNTVNTSLPLNDENGQLMFFLYVSPDDVTPRTLANLRCVRLLPSWFVPRPGYTAYTRNAYFNSGQELVDALNRASSTGGDDVGTNPRWVGNGKIQFNWDTATRRISITALSSSYIGLAAADDPFVLDLLRGTTNANNRIKMADFQSTSYAEAMLQPYTEGNTMNARLGFALKVNTKGIFWGNTYNSLYGIAQSTNTTVNNVSNGSIYSDQPPILLGVQNIGVYLSIVTGGGTDSKGRKNLIATVPIEGAPYSIASYTMCSVEVPSLSTANEIYEITVELICPETGVPYQVWGNANTSVGLVFYY